MTDSAASEAARALAARRPRVPIICEACGREFTATVRRDQTTRACSSTCRSKLHRQRKRQNPEVGATNGTRTAG